MLCGRVLLFLAKFLPLTERSGVNLLVGGPSACACCCCCARALAWVLLL